MGRPDPNGCGVPLKPPEGVVELADLDSLELTPPTTVIRLDAEAVINLAGGGSMQVGDVAIEGAPEHECMCGTFTEPHERGCEGCEYHDHHCATCHREGHCTAAACGFPQRPSTRPMLVLLPPEVVAAAVELRRLAETPTGRNAAKARAAWAAHLKSCPACRAWATAQERAPRGKIAVTDEECPEERRLMAAANAAEKAHVEAEEKRARLPLVLVAWIEGLAGDGSGCAA